MGRRKKEDLLTNGLQDVINNIEERFGKEAISGLKNNEVDFISSGIFSLDLILGGGFAKGRVIELYGWESSGKSTIALMLAAQVQKTGKAVGYIDAEQAMDLDYANNLGVNTNFDSGLWLMSQPDNGEQGLEIAREMLKSNEIGLIVIDSVTALIPKAVILGEAGDSKMGLHARLMSSMLPTMISPARKNGTIVLFINQLREKIGVMFGNPQTTTGGNALKFYASQRLEITRVGQNKDGDEVLSNKTRVKITKNKVAPPYQRCEFDIRFGTGVDILKDFTNIAIELGVINKSGSWFSYKESKLGQGINSVLNLLKEDIDVYEDMYNEVVTILNN